MTTYLDATYHILHQAGQPLRYEQVARLPTRAFAAPFVAGRPGRCAALHRPLASSA